MRRPQYCLAEVEQGRSLAQRTLEIIWCVFLSEGGIYRKGSNIDLASAENTGDFRSVKGGALALCYSTWLVLIWEKTRTCLKKWRIILLGKTTGTFKVTRFRGL